MSKQKIVPFLSNFLIKRSFGRCKLVCYFLIPPKPKVALKSSAQTFLSDSNPYFTNHIHLKPNCYADGQVRIGAIYHDGPAEQAGLQSGDTVLSINGDKPLFTDYCDFLRNFAVADQEHLELVIWRDGLELEINLDKATIL